MRKTKDLSEEDDFSAESPEEVEDAPSDDDCYNSAENETAPKKRPQRSTAGKKRTHSDEEENDDEDEEFDDEEEEEDEEEDEESESDSGKKPKRKRRSARNEPTEEDEEEEEEDSDEEIDESGEPPKDFTSGAFVVAKSDMANGDSDPTLWRIDGKALLQKYLPMKENGKTLYKSTSTYSGWSAANKDNYYAAKVTFKQQGKDETIVELSPINKEGEENSAEVVKEAKED